MNPKISIITVCFNCKDDIEDTIISVTEQKYSNIEYIIIDGGSTDGTLDIIRKYDSQIDLFISEPDNGIFDAMNKGIKAATGIWMNFMNAGDRFYDGNVLSRINFSDYPEHGLIYGNTEYKIGIRKPFPISSLSYGLIMACHQSMFFNKDILKANLNYSNRFILINEFDLVCRIIKNGFKHQYIDVTIAHFIGGGISTKKSYQARIARYSFVWKHYKINGLIKTILESIKLIPLPKRIS
jgi:glycosyltransferase involved in cell wall biosynthesis